jgi:tetratricopeptide (TPR) repeat protein
MAKWKAKFPPPTNSSKPGEALPDPKDKIDVQNLLHRAMLAGDDNRSSEARQFLEKALQIDPSSPTAFRQLGELELAAGDFSNAAVHLKRACEQRRFRTGRGDGEVRRLARGAGCTRIEP